MYDRSLLCLDHPSHSRSNLGPGIFGKEYEVRVEDMESASQELLNRLLLELPAAIDRMIARLEAEQCG